MAMGGPATGFGLKADAANPGQVEATEPPERTSAAAATVLLLLLVGAGTAMRLQGLSTLGFYRDDAWAALSSRVGLGTAWHMWVTAPGFSFLERIFIGLHPGSTWWAQLPPLVAGIAAIPAMYLLARYFRFSRITALVTACVVCVSPVCLIYSTRVKEYSTVFLVSVAVLWVAEAARRRPDRHRLVGLVALSVLAFAISASLGPVIAGVWIALGISALRGHDHRWDVIVAGLIAAALCAVVAAIFYRDISPALTRFWSGSYIRLGSADAFFVTVRGSLSNLYADLLHLSVAAPADQLLLVIVVLGVSVVGALRNPAMLGPACAVVVAFGLSMAQKAPLGTGRTDEYLYPVLLLLLASGVVRLWAATREHLHPAHARAAGVALAAAAGILAAALVADSIATAPSYPGVDIQALAGALHRNALPSDHIVVGELTRYPWAYYEDNPVRLRFGPDWATSFTVASTDPKVFIVPSEFYEGGSQPVHWAATFRKDRRLWFVLTPPRSLNPTYAALVHAGWHPVRTLYASGCSAILLER